MANFPSSVAQNARFLQNGVCPNTISQSVSSRRERHVAGGLSPAGVAAAREHPQSAEQKDASWLVLAESGACIARIAVTV
jgi:hypothetical protein